MNRRTISYITALTLTAVTGLSMPAMAQVSPAISVDRLGCTDGAFSLNRMGSGYDGGQYAVRTKTTIGGVIYQNNAFFSNLANGPSTSQVIVTGAVGVWPMPQNQPMTIERSIERPAGTVLTTWRTIVDGCNTGNITFNAQVYPASIPSLTSWALLGLMGALMLVGLVGVQRRRRHA